MNFDLTNAATIQAIEAFAKEIHDETGLTGRELGKRVRMRMEAIVLAEALAKRLAK